MPVSMSRIRLFFVVVASLVVVLVLRYGYDTLIDEQHRLHVAHGRMLVEQQRRMDLVTRCWDAVDRYQGLEQKIQQRLVTLNGMIKTGADKARISDARSDLTQLIAELDMLKESYPGLKAKDPYAYLMDTMLEAGLRVTNARIVYNERVYHYNVMCRLFPFVLFARLFGYEQEHFMVAEATGVKYR